MVAQARDYESRQPRPVELGDQARVQAGGRRGHAAVAKLDVYKGETHFSTDYMLLYRFDAGWRIVSKVFAVPG